MKIKICGIRDVKTAVTACHYGADALGFVFAPSKRLVTVEEAAVITNHVPMNVLKIGVFVNEDMETIRNIFESCLLDYVQLHGDEDEEYVWNLRLPTIKAFSISSEKDVRKAIQFPSEYILFDSPRETYYGGNGSRFNWELLKDYRIKKKIILAGGLNTENVSEAISIVHPYMVDVSSGVERNGIKDIKQIRQFIKKAKGVNV